MDDEDFEWNKSQKENLKDNKNFKDGEGDIREEKKEEEKV